MSARELFGRSPLERVTADYPVGRRVRIRSSRLPRSMWESGTVDGHSGDGFGAVVSVLLDPNPGIPGGIRYGYASDALELEGLEPGEAVSTYATPDTHGFLSIGAAPGESIRAAAFRMLAVSGPSTVLAFRAVLELEAASSAIDGVPVLRSSVLDVDSAGTIRASATLTVRGAR